ncbi:MAG: hypothetical protein LC659_05565, partial [Myxococcales bacterium]|nr:hypothetical protein [Myxococcales bacterium]
MNRRLPIFAGCLVATLAASSARAEDGGSAERDITVVDEAPSRAADVAREGQLLPQTFSATIGHKQVIGVFTGGYDSAANQGPQLGALVEGQLWNRVALRVGVDCQDAIHSVYPSVGLRVGILRQDQHEVDVAVIGEYKNVGFSEASGELELGVLVGHRWGKLGAQLKARDAEVRASILWYAHSRINV